MKKQTLLLVEELTAYLKDHPEDIRSMIQEMHSYDSSFERLQVYDNDEDFFETHFSNPYEAVRAAHFGDFEYNDDYIRFNGYGNLETLSEYEMEEEMVDNLDEVITQAIEKSEYDFSHLDEVQDLLNQIEEAEAAEDEEE